MAMVKVHQFFILKVADCQRQAAGFVRIWRVSEQRGCDGLLQQSVSGAFHPLHFIEHIAVVFFHGGFLIIDGKVYALLKKYLFFVRHQGIEYRVEIDVGEIHKILLVGA